MASRNAPETRENGTVERPDAMARLIALMSGRAEMESNDVSGSTVKNVNDILLAEDESAMWDADDRASIGGRDLNGVIQRITGITVKYGTGATSDGEEMKSIFIDRAGRTMYVLVRATRMDRPSPSKLPNVATGEEFEWNTSAPRLVAKLFWLEQHDKFPVNVVVEATDLGAGKAVTKLRPAPVMSSPVA